MAIQAKAIAGTYDRISFGHRNEFLMGYEYEIDSLRYSKRESDGWGWLEWTGVNNKLKLPSRFYAVTESLGETMGLEIKSPVAPLQYHKLRFAVLSRNVNLKHSRTNHGGIHVHVNRPDNKSGWKYQKCEWGYVEYNAFPLDMNSRDQSIFMFMHNKRIRDDFLRRISGRRNDSWEEYCCGGYSDHYGVINYRQDNYEIRVFKAKPHLLIPALEFADGIFSYAYSKTEAFDLTISGLIQYLSKYKKYKNISQLISEKYNG